MATPIRSRFVTIFISIVCVFFAVFCVVVAFVPAETVSVKSLPAAAILAALALGAWAVAVLRFATAARYFSQRAWMIRVLGILAALVLFLVELVIGRSVYELSSGWDVDFVRGASVELSRDGKVDDGIAGYLGTFPNNVGVVTVLTAVLHVVDLFGADKSDPAIGVIVANSLLLTSTVVVTTLIAHRRWGLRGASATAALSALLVGLSPWVAVPYSDSFGVLFPVLALGMGYLAYQSTGVARIVLVVLAAFALALGTFIKPSALVIGIAAAIVVAVAMVVRKGARKRLAVAAVVAIAGMTLGTLAFSAAGSALLSRNVAVHAIPFPVEYFALVGLSENLDQNPPSWGSYNGNDAALMDDQDTLQKRKDVAIAEIRARLGAMGPLGYAEFLAQKSRWILSDGTFGQDYEGWRGAASNTYTDPLSSHVRAFVRGQYGPVFALGTLLQAAWLVVLAAIGLRLVPRLRGSIEYLDIVVFVSIAGVMAYTLLGEGRARYLFIFAPLFVLAAAGFLARRRG